MSEDGVLILQKLIKMDDYEKVRKIAKKLVECKCKCEGINEKSIPRGLYYGEEKKGKGVIVVGLNPGRAKGEEKKEYEEKEKKYDIVEKYWKKIKVGDKYKHTHYKKTKNLLDLLDFDGPIIWTELVKCESEKNGIIPIETMRTCINKFIKEEIELFSDYPIICLGNKAFEFCALSFPKRFVIGIPHPNSRGHLDELINKVKKDNKYKDKIERSKKKAIQYKIKNKKVVVL